MKSDNLQNEIEERIESLGGIVTKIVHDIRNPLGSIELITSLLRKELNNDSDKQRLIDHVIYGVKNIDNILSNLLHFTTIPRPKLKKVRIEDVLNKCLDVLSYTIIKHQITVIKDIPQNLRILCDETLMRQVFVNLLLNSIQAISSGGVLSVRVSEDEVESGVEINIKDSGSGIPPEYIERIFDPFFTTKNKGTGLGLTIVHNIIKVHGGSVRVQSKLGEGTTFIIRLGLLPQTENAKRAQSLQLAAGGFNTVGGDFYGSNYTSGR